MRKLDDVIVEASAVEGVPSVLKDRLNYILKERIPYCPPESVGLMWHESQVYINSFMPGNPKELVDWQKKFLKVWTGKDF